MSLKKFNEESIEDTESAWLNAADSYGIPTLDYELVLTWMKSHVNYDVEHDSSAYGIFSEESTEADAIVDVVYTKRPGPDVGWIKMLRVWLSPKYSPAELESDNDKINEVLDIYTESIKGTILLTGTHTAKVIKLYGRDNNLLLLLQALKERLSSSDAFNQKIKAKMEDRWLVISIA